MLSKILSWILLVLVTLIGAVFGLTNPHLVKVNFLFLQLTLPLSVIITLFISTGLIFGWLISQYKILQLKYHIKKLSRKITEQRVKSANQIQRLETDQG